MGVLGTVLLVVGVMAGFVVLGVLWATADRKNEVRRRAFSRVAVTLRNYGLLRLAEILECYAIGDYSGFFKAIYRFADLLDESEEVVMKEMDTVFERVLVRKLATPAGLAYIKAKIAEVDKPATVVASAQVS